jgi:hypothetical protein
MSWRALRPVAIFLAGYIIISEGFTWAYNDGGLVAPPARRRRWPLPFFGYYHGV